MQIMFFWLRKKTRRNVFCVFFILNTDYAWINVLGICPA